MGNSVTFRLNPKHAEDRAIIEWLDANAGTEGGQTALVKAALLSVIQENNESDYYQKMLKEVQVAISKENKVFAGTRSDASYGKSVIRRISCDDGAGEKAITGGATTTIIVAHIRIGSRMLYNGRKSRYRG